MIDPIEKHLVCIRQVGTVVAKPLGLNLIALLPVLQEGAEKRGAKLYLVDTKALHNWVEKNGEKL